MIRTCTGAYQGVKNVSFSKKPTVSKTVAVKFDNIQDNTPVLLFAADTPKIKS